MCVHMAGLMRDSVRPWGVSSSRSREGFSVARAAVSNNTTQYRQHPTQFMSETTNKRMTTDKHSTTPDHTWVSGDYANQNTARPQVAKRHTSCKRHTKPSAGTHVHSPFVQLQLHMCPCNSTFSSTRNARQGETRDRTREKGRASKCNQAYTRL